jgi:hypothetical protein
VFTTDGVPVKVRGRNAFVGLCRKDKSVPVSIAYHCTIHQEVLCTKVVSFKRVINAVTKANSILSVNLKHRLFKAVLEGVESEYAYSGLILRTDVRWQCTGRVVSRFLEPVPEIQEFLESINEKYEQLTGPYWLLDLAFLRDLTVKINVLNLELQVKDKNNAAEMPFQVPAAKNGWRPLIYSITKIFARILHIPSV